MVVGVVVGSVVDSREVWYDGSVVLLSEALICADGNDLDARLDTLLGYMDDFMHDLCR